MTDLFTRLDGLTRAQRDFALYWLADQLPQATGEAINAALRAHPND